MVQLRKVTQFQPATLNQPNEGNKSTGGSNGKEIGIKGKGILKTTTNTSTKSNSSAKGNSSTPTPNSATIPTSRLSAKNTLLHINQCHLCSKNMHDQEAVIKYKTASFHVRCFKCTACGGSMRNKKVYEDVTPTTNGSDSSLPTSSTSFHLFCERCYLVRLDRCTACGRLIEQGRIVILGEKTKLHQSCFVCFGCKVPLEVYIEEVTPAPKPKVRPPFTAKAPKPPSPIVRRFCQPCYLTHCLPCCTACRKVLRINEAEGTMEQLLAPDGRVYHPECFRCDDCGGSLDMTGEGGRSFASSISADGGHVNKEFFPVGRKKLCRVCAQVAETKEAEAAANLKSTSGRKNFV